MRRNALGPWMRGDSCSGHWSKGGEEVVSDLGARVELGNLLLRRLPIECPHPHPQPWKHHQVLEESMDSGIKLLLLAFIPGDMFQTLIFEKCNLCLKKAFAALSFSFFELIFFILEFEELICFVQLLLKLNNVSLNSHLFVKTQTMS